MHIRPATSSDQSAIWPIFKAVVSRGDSYTFAPDISKQDAMSYWMNPAHHCYVATADARIVGTYIIKDNQTTLGAHVANASFMVTPDARDQGVGEAMGHHALAEAKRLSYHAMQFNMVVASNKAAIRLWIKLGFHIIGTVPNAFNHQQLGLTDAHIMYKTL